MTAQMSENQDTRSEPQDVRESGHPARPVSLEPNGDEGESENCQPLAVAAMGVLDDGQRFAAGLGTLGEAVEHYEAVCSPLVVLALVRVAEASQVKHHHEGGVTAQCACGQKPCRVLDALDTLKDAANV